MTKIQVLDKGYIELIDTFGDSLTVVNAARVSFGSEKKELDNKDKRLIKYLYKRHSFNIYKSIMRVQKDD